MTLIKFRFMPFMEAIRSRDYARARDMLDRRDKLTGARWLYRAEDYVCKKLYGPESEERVVYKELVSAHLKKAKGNYKAGEESDFEILRAQCAFVLECIKNDSFPTRLSSEVRDPFVRWFDDAVGIEIGDPRRVGELLSYTKDSDKRRELCQVANLRAIRSERARGKEDDLIIPQYRMITEQTLSEKGWEGVIDLWRLGDREIASVFQRFIAQVFIEKHEENIPNGILNFANARSFPNAEHRNRFYEVLSRVFAYASEAARRKGQELDYLLCDGYARLLWTVANGNATGTSLALRSIFDALGVYAQGKHMQYREVFGFCYLLMSLDPRTVLSGDRRIYFFAGVKDYLEDSVYEDLLDPEGLLVLQDQQLVDNVGSARAFLTNLRNVERTITSSEALPEFEKAVLALLLRELGEVAQRLGSER